MTKLFKLLQDITLRKQGILFQRSTYFFLVGGGGGGVHAYGTPSLVFRMDATDAPLALPNGIWELKQARTAMSLTQ